MLREEDAIISKLKKYRIELLFILIQAIFIVIRILISTNIIKMFYRINNNIIDTIYLVTILQVISVIPFMICLRKLECLAIKIDQEENKNDEYVLINEEKNEEKIDYNNV